MKLRSQRAIKIEYGRICKMRRTRVYSYADTLVAGAQQALAWALNDNAAAPAICFGYKKPRKSPTHRATKRGKGK